MVSVLGFSSYEIEFLTGKGHIQTSCVAVCCSFLQCVAVRCIHFEVCCSVLQCLTCMRKKQYNHSENTHEHRVLQCVAVCVAVCCSVLQCVAVPPSYTKRAIASTRVHRKISCVAVCCSVLQCVAVCCSVLQRAEVCCSVLQCLTHISKEL